MKQKKKKKTEGGGARQPWKLPHPRWQAFSFFLLEEDKSSEREIMRKDFCFFF